MYQAPTRLSDEGTISSLAEYVKSGEIDLNAINSGEENLVIICAATFILTAIALKKFKRDIAFNLNSGRTRQ